MRLTRNDLRMGQRYKVRGRCLCHGQEICEYIGILTFIGETTFAFDSVNDIAKHQFRFRDYLELELIDAANNKSAVYMLDREY